MHDDDRHGARARWLPMTMAERLNAGLHFNQSLFRLRKVEPASQEKRPKRLEMASSQETAPSKLGDFDWRLRSVHGWFLIKEAVEKSQAASGELLMPIFEYKCKECDHEFEALVYGKEKADCPKCRSSKLEPKLSVFAVSSKGTSPSPGAPSACGSCGDPRGPGACSMN